MSRKGVYNIYFFLLIFSNCFINVRMVHYNLWVNNHTISLAINACNLIYESNYFTHTTIEILVNERHIITQVWDKDIYSFWDIWYTFDTQVIDIFKFSISFIIKVMVYLRDHKCYFTLYFLNMFYSIFFNIYQMSRSKIFSWYVVLELFILTPTWIIYMCVWER